MKKLIVLLVIVSLVLAMAYGCGKKEAEETDKLPVEVKQAEQMDSTRMDSAAMDTATADTVEVPTDSM
ncbi:MAG: hypothetical protein JSV52_03710 [Candidatus Zixiibacteriota bacterium]|nr:MAG: hypothetical protein JSV52_03710 [candidate division Zixibacteria bacterium]